MKENMKQFEYNIGIGVTEHNRPEVLEMFLKNIKKYMPENAKLVIVDDASDIPVKNATYRFEENAGIARSKNKCLELLQDCKHIFLFDDDCWPKTKNWWKPYVESREPHLCYIFKDFIDRPANDCRIVYEDSKLIGYSHARGCMFYIENRVLDVVGGMDSRYKRWGYEHVDYSNRIYNAGLTRFRFQDVPDSFKLIYSMDEHVAVNSTVTVPERMAHLKEMKQHFENSWTSREYCNYRSEGGPQVGNNIILTCYFTGHEDTMRKITWKPNFKQLQPLIDSMHGQKLVILHDCFDDIETPENVELVRVETCLNPYFQRWASYHEYLLEHPEIEKVFCVDATDVEMLKNPFHDIVKGRLYLGTEPIQLYNNWMIAQHRNMIGFFRKNATLKLLNAGIVGGYRDDVFDFIHDINAEYFGKETQWGNEDMGIFNWVARENHNIKLSTGPHVNTRFKAYETNNKTAWFKHK